MSLRVNFLLLKSGNLALNVTGITSFVIEELEKDDCEYIVDPGPTTARRHFSAEFDHRGGPLVEALIERLFEEEKKEGTLYVHEVYHILSLLGHYAVDKE